VAVHRLTRALDDDPYTDVLWGILTGYDAADALRIAKYDPPLVIKRGAAGTGLDLEAFEQAIWFSEGERGAKFVKLPDASGKQKCPDDSTASMVEMLNTFRPQLFMTSGHATFRDWQIGFSYRNGQFRCKDGQLFGLDLQGQKFPINSPEPKVYLPCGNCLIGLIPDRQAMVLAWLHSGGAYQMAGYTVSTFFGYGGWGIRDYFIGQAGRFTFAEAFAANNLALVHQLQTRFPKHADVNLDQFDIESDPSLPNRLAQKYGVTERDELGLLWDRDTVAFYGDPAWEARMAQTRKLPWTQKLTEHSGTYTFEITTETKGSWGGRPVVQFLPHRVNQARLVSGADLKPVITDNFILVPLTGDFTAGQRLKVVLSAQRLPARK
jgi:zinc protease